MLDAESAPAEDQQGHGEDGSPDAGPVADAGQATVALDLEALGDIEREFADVDQALRRLDDGTYWTCESCGDGIDEAVLDEAPLGRRCARCTAVERAAPGAAGATAAGPTAAI
jgi:DnaK suppressor protein